MWVGGKNWNKEATNLKEQGRKGRDAQKQEKYPEGVSVGGQSKIMQTEKPEQKDCREWKSHSK